MNNTIELLSPTTPLYKGRRPIYQFLPQRLYRGNDS
jgi:hypothetical protein